jgi:hypothetical protein
MLSAAPAASAQTSVSGYSTPEGSVQQRLGGGDAPKDPSRAADTDGGGLLPFSGLDLGLVGGAGAVLLAMGLAVRRIGAGDSP